MSEKLVLHIGTHKTGTTALQGALSASNDALEAAGFSYPLMPEKWPHIKQNRNAYWLSMAALQETGKGKVNHPGKIPACLKCFTQAVAASDKTLILSDERMWYIGATTKGYWKAVRDIVERAGVKNTQIIVYLRRQDLFAESLWAQYVKGNTRLEQSLIDYLSKRKTLSICDYAAGIKKLQRVFGEENIIVRVYDKSQLVGGNTIDDFLAALGIESHEGIVRPSKSSNDSLSPSMTALKLAVNKNPEYKYASSNYLLPAFLEISRQDDVKRGSFLTPEQRKAFLANFESGNAELAQEFFQRDELFVIREGELEQEAFQPDAQKLADQAGRLIAIATQSELLKHSKETERLKEKVSALERRESSRFGSKVKRFLSRGAKRLSGRTDNGKASR